MTEPRKRSQIEQALKLRDQGDFAAANALIDEAESAGLASAEAMIARGRVESSRGVLAEALTLFESAAELDPELPEALAWRIAGLSRMYRFEEAHQLADEGRERFPESAAVGVATGRLYFDQDRPVEALEEFDGVLERHPEDEEALDWRADCLRRLCRYEEAELAARHALALWPDSWKVRVALIDLYQRRYQYEEALGQVEEALVSDPDLTPALRWRIFLLRSAFRYEEAERCAQEAVERFPFCVGIIREWGACLLARQDVEGALELLDRALKVNRNSWWASEERLDILREAGRHDEMMDSAKDLLEKHPYALGAQVAMGWSIFYQEDFNGALAIVEKSLKANPGDLRSRGLKGFCLARMGRWEEADEFLGKAIEASPHRAINFVLRGILVRDEEEKIRALEFFECAVQLDPYYVWGWEKLAQVLSSLGRHAEAEERLNEAESWLSDPRLNVERSRALVAQERNIEALCQLDLALQRDPLLFGARVERVRVLIAQCRYLEAERSALAALEMRPRDSELLEELANVYLAQNFDRKALEVLRRARREKPDSQTLLMAEVRALKYLERHVEAERLLRRGLDKGEGKSFLHWCLGDLFRWQGRYEDALREFDLAHGDGDDHLFVVPRVRTLRECRRFTEAEILVRSVMEHLAGDSELLVEFGLLLTGQGRDTEAEEFLKSELRRSPLDIQLRLSLIGLYDSLGREEEALLECEEILKLTPKNVRALLEKIYLLRELRRYSEAEQVAREAARSHPYHPDFPRDLGRILLAQGRYEEALAEFGRLHKETGDHLVVYDRSKTLRRMGRYDEAAAFLQEAFTQRPNYARALTELCEVHWQQGRGAEALRVARQAVETEPYGASAHITLVRALRRLRRFPEAEKAAQLALERVPHDEDLAIELGRVYEDTNRQSEALRYYELALEYQPQYNKALIAKSSVLRTNRRFGEAERIVREAISRFLRHRDLREELGWILRDQGRFGDAEWVFAQLLEDSIRDEERADALIGLGWVAFTDDRYSEAERRFRDANEADPLNSASRVGIAWALARQDSADGWAEAEEICLEIMDTDPDHHRVRTCLGVLHYRRGDYAVAEVHLKHTVETSPHHGSYVDLGSLYVQTGRFAEAREMFDEALKRDRHDLHAHVGRGSLLLRQAIEPGSVPASIGLAIALSSGSGDLMAAERVLREALRRQRHSGDNADWKLRVALARLLIERGDATQRREQYVEALTVAQEAIELAAKEADPYFVAGVAAFKAGEQSGQVQARPKHRRQAAKYLKDCVRLDPAHPEARTLFQLAKESIWSARIGRVSGWVLTGLSIGLLIVLWVGLFRSDQVTTVMATTLTPILVAVSALGAVFPLLTRLKLPGGVEADLAASLQQVSSGPTGDISVGPGQLGGSPGESAYGEGLGEGPRGHLWRLDRE